GCALAATRAAGRAERGTRHARHRPALPDGQGRRPASAPRAGAPTAFGARLSARATRSPYHSGSCRHLDDRRGAHRRGDPVPAPRRELLGRMATYAIGDIQGCYDELRRLLKDISFQKSRDRLWFVGDLVNRGPKSLQVLRFVRDLGEKAVTVLGNHDLHLVTQYEGFERKRKDDTFDDVLEAKHAKELVDWLRTRPMMHADE